MSPTFMSAQPISHTATLQQSWWWELHKTVGVLLLICAFLCLAERRIAIRASVSISFHTELVLVETNLAEPISPKQKWDFLLRRFLFEAIQRRNEQWCWRCLALDETSSQWAAGPVVLPSWSTDPTYTEMAKDLLFRSLASVQSAVLNEFPDYYDVLWENESVLKNILNSKLNTQYDSLP